MRKVYATIKVGIVINLDDSVELSDVINEMHYDFCSNSTGADIIDTEIKDYVVEDSK